jgi:hypothetical protein
MGIFYLTHPIFLSSFPLWHFIETYLLADYIEIN